MRDALYGGKVFRNLNVIDGANRSALGVDVAVSIPAVRVIAFMLQLILAWPSYGDSLRQRPSAHLRCVHHLVQRT